MSRRFSWPRFDTDLLGKACLVVIAVCLAKGAWPVVVFTLGVALACAISLRMKGPFEISSGTTTIKGAFDDAAEAEIVKAGVIGKDRELGLPPSSREPDAD